MYQLVLVNFLHKIEAIMRQSAFAKGSTTFDFNITDHIWLCEFLRHVLCVLKRRDIDKNSLIAEKYFMINFLFSFL